jgi:hypothetical protein
MLDPGAALGIPGAGMSPWTMLVTAYIVFGSSALMPCGQSFPRQVLQDLRLLSVSIVCLRRWQLVPLSWRSAVSLIPLGLITCHVLSSQPFLLLLLLVHAPLVHLQR